VIGDLGGAHINTYHGLFTRNVCSKCGFCYLL